MSKKIMKLIDPRTCEMVCMVCGAKHFANIKPLSNGKYYRGSWQCQNGCKLPEKTSRQELLRKILRQQLALIRNQKQFELLRASDTWNELPRETKAILEEMSGGIWLTGDEIKEIELKSKSLERLVMRGEFRVF